MKKVVLALAVGIVLAAGAYHFWRGARAKSSQPCWHKLMNIASAKDQRVIEKGAKSGAPITAEDIMPYLQSMPTCHVAGATFIIGKVGEEPRCTVHGTVSHFNPDRY
jgi:hypothetical protein